MILPRLMLVADQFATGRAGGDPDDLHRCLALAVRAGVGWVQLRDHEADDDVFRSCARHATAILRQANADVLISVNTSVIVAAELGAGLHIGWRGPPVGDARRMIGDGLLTVSVHDLEEAAAALDGADALVFGPVFATRSKPHQPGAGVDALAEVCRAAGDTPVLAIGGIRPDSVGACVAAGAYGVSVLSAILDARPAAVPIVVSAFRHALRGHES